MTTFVVFGLNNISDEAGLRDYQAAGLESLAGRNVKLAAGPGNITTLEGDPLSPFVILEFPTRAEAEDWYHSEAYQKAKAIRLRSADTFALMVDANA